MGASPRRRVGCKAYWAKLALARLVEGRRKLWFCKAGSSEVVVDNGVHSRK